MTTMLAVGPYGATQGTLQELPVKSKTLKSITIYSSTNSPGGKIQGISFTYATDTGEDKTAGTWGMSTGASSSVITIPTGTYVSNLSGTYDTVAVRSLKVSTTSGDIYGPYGDPTPASGTTMKDFEIPIHSGAIVGFFAHSTSSVLCAVGAYVGPQA